MQQTKGSQAQRCSTICLTSKLQKANRTPETVATEALRRPQRHPTAQTDDIDTQRRSGLPPAYLLDFDYDKKYQRTTAIVSSGNPDTATHVSTLVPGIGTNVRDSLGQ